MAYYRDIQESLQFNDLEQYLQLELISEIDLYIEEHNISYKDLCDMSGVSVDDVSDLLEGYTRCYTTASKLLKALGLKVSVSLIK